MDENLILKTAILVFLANSKFFLIMMLVIVFIDVILCIVKDI